MFHWLNTFFQSSRSTHSSRASRKIGSSPLRVEELEQRALPSVTPVALLADLRADMRHEAHLEVRLDRVQFDIVADKAAYAKDLADLKADTERATLLAGQRDKFLDAAAKTEDAGLKRAFLEKAKDLEANLDKTQADIKADKVRGLKDTAELETDSAKAGRLQAKLAEVKADISADELELSSPGPITPPPAA